VADLLMKIAKKARFCNGNGLFISIKLVTFIPNYHYEIWVRVNNQTFTLKNAYLQILFGESEILSLHCDPLEPHISTVYKYKCGPHIHVKHPTNESISNAHIALNLSNFDDVTKSLQSFEKAFKAAITMIKDEFIK
jgi:hypothetical protein